MPAVNGIHILIADGADAERQMMADIMALSGFRVTQAIDGGTAIKVIEEQGPVHIVVFAHKMSPKAGLDLVRHIKLHNYDIGMVMIANDLTTDLLAEASKYEIQQIIGRPVNPDRLAATVRRVLRAKGHNPAALAKQKEPAFTPEQLMIRAIALADQNARSGMGGPFGAVVADGAGKILGEGVNSVSNRCDPTAHAEVVAIRQATDKLNKTDLSGCTLYCSSEPTMLGQALIISTGIEKVFYGLSHREVGVIRSNEEGILGEIKKPLAQRSVPYHQLMHDESLTMFQAWERQKKKTG